MNYITPSRSFRLSPGGVECDEYGLRVGGVALIVVDAAGKWVALSAHEISCELSKAYGFPVDFTPKQRGLDVVARALEYEKLAEAQVATLLLQLPEPLRCRQISKVDRQRLSDELLASGLIKVESGRLAFEMDAASEFAARENMQELIFKYNFNPDEPRDSRGRWANEGRGGSPETTDARISDAVYPGDFHDQVAQDEIEHYRNTGAVCVSELRLALGAVTARVDILCRGKTGLLLGVEVKTGQDPQFTANQNVVYDHAILGGLTSPDPKIAQLGFTPNQPLPPIEMFMLYVAGPGGDKHFYPL